MPQAKLLQLLQLHNCPNNHCNPRRLQPLHILGIIYIYTYYIYIGLCTEWRFKKYRHGIYHCSWMFFCSFAAAWWRLLLVVLFVCNIIIYYCIAIIAFMIYKRTTYIYMHNIMIIYIIFIIIYIYVCVCTPMNWGLHGRYYQKGTWSIQNNLQPSQRGEPWSWKVKSYLIVQ